VLLALPVSSYFPEGLFSHGVKPSLGFIWVHLMLRWGSPDLMTASLFPSV
jgi:hypothetical protein